MSRGRPSSNIRTDHFYLVEEENTNANKYSTLRQMCKYCNKDVVDLIDRLKDHLNKCSFFPYELQESTDLTTSKSHRNNNMSQNDKVILDQKLAQFFYSAGIPFSAIENLYWIDFIHTIRPSYNSPNHQQLANKLLDDAYSQERKYLENRLENINNISLVSDR
ncbi:10285_t:CDS:2 [Scutellospora calospora]|uniref:10285_t:CDS:1 n=1 Tax=Scutellospora calospora TaxID=85575 RepID=A0ACA9JUQ5_9GLOM|nr:10285_t:CDS:2 [Scutellospora calospora]